MKQERRAATLEPDAAGIDIGAEEIYVAVPPDRDAESTRRFGTFTCDLSALAEWLDRCGVRTVAMESTGIYWIPLVSDPRGARIPGVPGECALPEECSWPEERRVRLPVDSVPALGRIATNEFSSARSYLCRSSPMATSCQSVADGCRAHYAYAKGLKPNESADSSRSQ